MNGSPKIWWQECPKRRKKPEERIYPKKDWPVGYEPTEKEFEEWMEEGTGIPVSFHWEDIGGGKKRGVFTPIKLMEEGKNELKEIDEWDKMDAEFKAIRDEWKKAEAERKKRETELGITIPTNYTRKHSWRSWNNDGSIGEERMYIESEIEKTQIIERNRKIRELEKKVDLEQKTQNSEKSQTENLEDKQVGENNSPQKNEIQQENKHSKSDSDWKSKSLVWGGVGIVGLLGIAVGVVKWKRG